MSWQAYVDTNLVGTGKVKKAAIYGHDGNPWATSPAFTLSKGEFDRLFAAFQNADSIRREGLHIAGDKYIALQCNERSIYAKKGSSGIVCVKSNLSILVGYYEEPTQTGEATVVVENLADYLISVGYVRHSLIK